MTTPGDVRQSSLSAEELLHAPFRADDWPLYVQETLVTSGARGHAHRRRERLAVSMVQDGLSRATSGSQG